MLIVACPSFIRDCHSRRRGLALRTSSSYRPLRSYTSFVFDNGKLPHALAGGRKHRVVQRRRKRRHAGFAHAGRRRFALHNLHVDVPRSAVHARDLKIVEIALVDDSVRSL